LTHAISHVKIANMFDSESLPYWLQGERGFLVLAVGLVTAVLVFATIRYLFERRKENPRSFFRLLLFRDPANVVPHMDALRNTPAGNKFNAIGMREKRRSFRRRDNIVEVLVSDAELLSEPVRGWVIDRSTTGLGLVLKKLVVEGTILTIRAANAPPDVPWVQIEVRSCEKNGKRFRLGCRFLDTPSWSVLLLFG
jgi:hypothetical protein